VICLSQNQAFGALNILIKGVKLIFLKGVVSTSFCRSQVCHGNFATGLWGLCNPSDGSLCDLQRCSSLLSAPWRWSRIWWNDVDMETYRDNMSVFSYVFMPWLEQLQHCWGLRVPLHPAPRARAVHVTIRSTGAKLRIFSEEFHIYDLYNNMYIYMCIIMG